MTLLLKNDNPALILEQAKLSNLMNNYKNPANDIQKNILFENEKYFNIFFSFFNLTQTKLRNLII